MDSDDPRSTRVAQQEHQRIRLIWRSIDDTPERPKNIPRSVRPNPDLT